jgi:hypothetical protein
MSGGLFFSGRNSAPANTFGKQVCGRDCETRLAVTDLIADDRWSFLR